MTTTQVFIELLIIGFGGLIWIILTILGLTGLKIDFQSLKDVSSLILFPMSGLAYIIGILLDRFGYQLFYKAERKNMRDIFKTENEQSKVANKIAYILLTSERYSGEIDYNRSRLRLCRSWVLNFFMISITLLFYAIFDSKEHKLVIVVLSITSFLLCICSFLAWKWLSIDYFTNIKSNFDNLIEIDVKLK